MELRTLRIFVAVVRHGGFSQAAKHVFVTQSAVSKAVRQLEDELGLALIDRQVPGVQLTDAGRVVFARAQQLLAQRDDLMNELDELKGVRRGQLTLGLPPIGSDALFAPIFAAYRARYPEIEVSLFEHGSRKLEELVTAGELELGASLLPFNGAFDWQDVIAEPLDVILRDDHPLSDQEKIGLSELSGEAFILFDSGFALNPIILDGCREAGFQPNVAARSSQINFIVELVHAGLGIGFLPRLIASQRVRPGVRHITLKDQGMVWHMAFIWRRGGYLSFAAKAWLDLAAELRG
ncbi:LysR family transcriptional regulator [Martelella sp. HB161492]|uniref:LysR family transcriptional regulator n=1 Tax=Martelella sp. HB161492 TaxID=2720726 RepID=UPI0015920127|nr:LysR family transcriptional regulator [Martelella sp. HB161492]